MKKLTGRRSANKMKNKTPDIIIKAEKINGKWVWSSPDDRLRGILQKEIYFVFKLNLIKDAAKQAGINVKVEVYFNFGE
jgi:hypothetical protein